MADDPQVITSDEPVVNEEAQPSSPPPDEPPVAPSVAPDEPTEPPAPEALEGEAEPAEPPAPSRREQLRVKALLEKYGPPPETKAPPTQGMDYSKELQADDETVQRLSADRDTAAAQAYREGVAQARTFQWRTLLDIDAPQIGSKYAFLNPQDEKEFYPALANSMNQFYLAMVGYDAGDAQKGIPETVKNNGIRYGEFVESMVELAQTIAEEMTQKTSVNIAKQAAQTSLRPDGSKAHGLNLNKAPQDMSKEELEAAIAQGIRG